MWGFCLAGYNGPFCFSQLFLILMYVGLPLSNTCSLPLYSFIGLYNEMITCDEIQQRAVLSYAKQILAARLHFNAR